MKYLIMIILIAVLSGCVTDSERQADCANSCQFLLSERSVPFERIEIAHAHAWLLKFADMRRAWFIKTRCSIDTLSDGTGTLTAPAWLLDANAIPYGD